MSIYSHFVWVPGLDPKAKIGARTNKTFSPDIVFKVPPPPPQIKKREREKKKNIKIYKKAIN